jgi:hypothetical protein
MLKTLGTVARVMEERVLQWWSLSGASSRIGLLFIATFCLGGWNFPIEITSPLSTRPSEYSHAEIHFLDDDLTEFSFDRFEQTTIRLVLHSKAQVKKDYHFYPLKRKPLKVLQSGEKIGHLYSYRLESSEDPKAILIGQLFVVKKSDWSWFMKRTQSQILGKFKLREEDEEPILLSFQSKN